MSTNNQQQLIQSVSKGPAPTDMLPTVMYDSVNRTITAEVVVSQPAGAGMLTISAPPVTIPSGIWTVNWELVESTAGLEASFAETGIILPAALPAGVTPLVKPSGSALLWTMQLNNEVMAAAAFNYEIGVASSAGVGLRKAKLHVTYHDPTIAVVRDPKDPPTIA